MKYALLTHSEDAPPGKFHFSPRMPRRLFEQAETR